MPQLSLTTPDSVCRRMAHLRAYRYSCRLRSHQILVPCVTGRAVSCGYLWRYSERGWYVAFLIQPMHGAHSIFIATGRDDVDLQTKVANVREIVHTLPGANFDLLKRIVEHLERYVVLPGAVSLF